MSTDVIDVIEGSATGAKSAGEQPKPVTQRIAFVSGGMGGIGTAVCRRLAGSGAKVVAGCLPDYERKDAWLQMMRAEGLQVHAAEGNVEDFDSCAEMFYKVGATIGPVDILVNNAGITRDGVFKRMSPSDWYAVINTNLNSVFNVTRQVVEGMTDRGWGRIINISSVNALKGQFGQTNYSAAKAGMHGFSKALAHDVVRRGVTVNTISGLCRHRHGHGDTAGGARPDRRADSDGTARPAGGNRRPDRLPGVGRGGLRDRRKYLHQWRPSHGVAGVAMGRGGRSGLY